MREKAPSDRAAEELEREAHSLAALLAVMPVAIVMTRADTTVTDWNPAAESLFGYPRDEAVGRNIDDLVAQHPDIIDEAHDVSRRAREGGQIHLVTKRTRKDRSLVDVDIVASAIFINGEVVGYYAIYTDISELQRQRRYYESLFDLSPTAIVTVDLDNRVTSWNPAAERL